MTEERHEGPGEKPRPIPRDMPDQQARPTDDPWDIRTRREDRPRTAEDAARTADDVPDTDEAGTGRRGAPHRGTVHPEHPAPDEPAD
ncbi:hypothetical protein ACIQ6V_16310 [Streptomyces sp. NPDC096198]|uniref:hypothetical protein n=1 Tax=Streptomyces sp. NPDC096198 TaxID=3366080 RepID=UPI003815C5EA